MRCAIYTRKSSSEGLEQSFNSLDAQRLACSHYIASQASEEWIELDARYDDGGYSGGTLARPALRRLLEDVESGAVGTVLVYKIDRLSRSLRDFVRLLEVFERHGVTFVSVTQHFSSTGSMGRLTLHVLLSFAQFERELTGERTRDKFAALRSKGMRSNGGRPFGYRVKDRLLVVDEIEAAIVARIFATFIRLGSPVTIPATLNRAGLVNQMGRPFDLSFVRRVLKNRLYRGDLVHRGRSTPGLHPSIVSERTWSKAQAVMAPHKARWGKRRPPVRGMLSGLLFGPTGALLHESSMSRGKLYRYYGPPRQLRRGAKCGASGRFRAQELERRVLSVVDPDSRLVRDPTCESAAANLLRSLVERIEIGDGLVIMLKTGGTIKVPNELGSGTTRQWRAAPAADVVSSPGKERSSHLSTSGGRRHDAATHRRPVLAKRRP